MLGGDRGRRQGGRGGGREGKRGESGEQRRGSVKELVYRYEGFRAVAREHKSTYVSSDGEYQLLVLPACCFKV